MAYEKGEMSSGEMKATATKELQNYVAAFRERRQAITHDIMMNFMKPRQLQFRSMPPAKERSAALKAQIASLKEETDRLEKTLAEVAEIQK